jgi:hypothetical protein
LCGMKIHLSAVTKVEKKYDALPTGKLVILGK